MRAIDDKIIYKLNTTIPTKSFAGQISAADQCKLLYDEVICVGESWCWLSWFGIILALQISIIIINCVV